MPKVNSWGISVYIISSYRLLETRDIECQKWRTKVPGEVSTHGRPDIFGGIDNYSLIRLTELPTNCCINDS